MYFVCVLADYKVCEKGVKENKEKEEEGRGGGGGDK